MPDGGVRELVNVLEESFRGDREHSMLASLWSVSDTDWAARLSEDGRSIRAIVRHVATATHAYYESAFGDGPPSWDRAEEIARTKVSREELMAWLTEGHEAAVASFGGLSAEQLDEPVANHWGEMVPARRIALTLIGHNYYHAGEINHLRSVLQGNDRWGHWGEMMPPPSTPGR